MEIDDTYGGMGRWEPWTEVKKAQCESCELPFSLGDYSLGDGHSGGSKELIRRGTAREVYIQSTTHLGRRLLLVIRPRYLSDFSAFLSVGKCKKLPHNIFS